eukprot:CAMPEP_0195587638 /NCGR_PEP_ID=MMETSP0814-20130614/31314_1 /TAXON_ID=97485 /ORGANISM="Prymnesium parvum, Strain Texoma1" /LENGTH=123 /DNA_ID=CAMNT_0040726441 /DNA_START=173 /DNA_END=542 /DNA_ORIENTATION=-
MRGLRENKLGKIRRVGSARVDGRPIDRASDRRAPVDQASDRLAPTDRASDRRASDCVERAVDVCARVSWPRVVKSAVWVILMQAGGARDLGHRVEQVVCEYVPGVVLELCEVSPKSTLSKFGV